MNDSNNPNVQPFDEEEYDRLFPDGFNLDESTNARIAAVARGNADFWYPLVPNSAMNPTLSSIQDPFRAQNDSGHTQTQYQPYPRNAQRSNNFNGFAPFPPSSRTSHYNPDPNQAPQNLHRQSLPSIGDINLSSPTHNSFSYNSHNHPRMSQRHSSPRSHSYNKTSFVIYKQDSEGIEQVSAVQADNYVEESSEEGEEGFSEFENDSEGGVFADEDVEEGISQLVEGTALQADALGDIGEDELASSDSEEEEPDPDYPWRTAKPAVTLTSTAQAKTAESSRIDRELAAVAGKSFDGIPKTESQKLRYVRGVKVAIRSLDGAQDNKGSNRIAAAYARFDPKSGAAKKFTDAQIEIASWKVVVSTNNILILSCLC
jgi:hypothetical protein